MSRDKQRLLDYLKHILEAYTDPGLPTAMI